MKDLLDGKIIGKLTFRHILILLSSIAITSSVFLAWLTYNNFGQTENLTGIDLYRKYAEFPEIPALPLIGTALFIGTLITTQLTEFATTSKYPKYAATILTIIALIISMETAIRLQPIIKDQIGINLFNNLGCGWPLATGGAITSLVAIIIPREKKEK